MKILVNKKIKSLFCWIIVLIAGFSLLFAILIAFGIKNAAIYILGGSLLMGILIVLLFYRYFKEQNRIMENAITQIKTYISGNQDARIECDDEGELYRLFHEVNTLVTILNAHVEKKENAKQFLKNTISDISHQLKTPLAALNIYNGIMQEEAKNSPTLMEFTVRTEQELDRIEMLVQNLLKITKLDAGTILIRSQIHF